jgi:hypothetical protein
MKPNKCLFIVLFLALAQSGQTFGGEGSGVGNGGDVIVCKDTAGNITNVELLDFYEARALRNLTLDLGAPELSIDEKLDLVADRWDRLDQNRVTYEVRYDVKRFTEEARFLSGVKLTDIPDSQHIAIPINCNVEQVAIQRLPEFPEDKFFTVSKDLWDRMDRSNQAGLILHEVLYKYFLENRTENTTLSSSVAARYLTGYASSNRFSTMTLPDYFKLIERVKHFTSVLVDGSWFLVNYPVYMHPNGILAMGWLENEYRTYSTGSGYCQTKIENAVTVTQYPSGKPEFVSTRPKENKPAQGEQITFGDGCAYTYGSVKDGFDFSFYEGAIPKGGFLTLERDIKVGGVLIELAKSRSIVFSQSKKIYVFERTGKPVKEDDFEFYPSGVLKTGVLNKGVTLLNVKNIKVTYKKGMKLKFDENGRVLSAQPGSQE